MSNYTRSEPTNKGPTVAHGHPSLRDAEHDEIESKTEAFIALGGRIEQVESHVVTVDYLKKRDNSGRPMK